MFEEANLLIFLTIVNRLTEAFKLTLERNGVEGNTKHILTLLASMGIGVFITVGFQINLLSDFPGFAGINALIGQIGSGIAFAGGGAILQALIDLKNGRAGQPPVIVNPPTDGGAVVQTRVSDNVATTVVAPVDTERHFINTGDPADIKGQTWSALHDPSKKG